MSILAPHELRDRLVRLYQAQFRRAYGIETDKAAVERLVIAELAYVEGARAAGDLRETNAKGRAVNVASDKRFDATPVADGPAPLVLNGDRPVDYRPRVLHDNPEHLGERFALAMGRICRICEGVGVAATFGASASTAEMPALARRWADAYGNFMTRAMPAPTRGVDHNQFRGLSDRDAARAFMREVENIADASTGKLGAWRVPK